MQSRNQLQQKLDDQILINQNLNFELNHTHSLLSTLIHHISLQTILTNIKRKIYNKESQHDLRRQKKLDFLIQNFKPVDYAKISVINFTKNKEVIPENIQKIVELGIKNPIGGIGNQTQILHKNELLFSNWLTYAQSRGLNVFKIAEIRSLLV